MDKNTTIGLILIALIIIVYGIYTKPSQEEIEERTREAKRRQDSLEMIEKERLSESEIRKIEEEKTTVVDTTNVEIIDSLHNADTQSKYGVFAEAAEGLEKFISLENNKIKVLLSTKGGKVYSVMLKEYKKYDSTKVVLFDGEKNVFGFKFFSFNRSIHTNQMFFEPSVAVNKITADNNEQSVSLKMKASNGGYIEYTYTIYPDSYLIDFDVRFVGLSEAIGVNSKYIDLEWVTDIPAQELGREWENNNTTIYYKILDDEVDYLNETKDNIEERHTTRLSRLLMSLKTLLQKR